MARWSVAGLLCVGAAACAPLDAARGRFAAQVVTYPAPAEEIAAADYRVEVNGRPVDVYRAESQYFDKKYYFASFDFSGDFAEHRKAWDAYWDESFVRLPDARLETAYNTAQYHLRANATRWSFPVGIFNTHWAGRFFGWDEMFCYQALVSSNHRDIARRGPEFRRAGLKVALDRAAHYGKPGLFGARYPWETLEDSTEASPPGFWMEHVFHMSNIALAAWFQYLYTEDLDYLGKTGYPVIKECARFFLANMFCDLPDGRVVIGKCTDRCAAVRPRGAGRVQHGVGPERHAASGRRAAGRSRQRSGRTGTATLNAR